ncbi:hypothetical protein FA743_06395 [Paracoccus gahaiensis]|uniref:RiboL-PSP-HEPN domain-containing protein n=1 Tax=Paracoccus gahaiensis TaxID=1706839 RepID=A0A4U0RBH2_9RHOB|nr:HEPN domain-containing protein [Paracoccus gahaiensis]TJZ92495.1 hypothetical protein FA743_06395 [Paracoccus gahaiensis]
MPRQDLDVHFAKIDALVSEINAIVPANGGYQSVQFRADLAGLLVVAIAATYETCVKEIMSTYATAQHVKFGGFTGRQYRKLNSKVKVSDLKSYCELFGPDICSTFRNRLKAKKKRILDSRGVNVEMSYEQILTWRHDFAHAWNRNTTIEEAAMTHRAGKIILYLFNEAFEQHWQADA